MPDRSPDLLPEKYLKYIDLPYGGLFGNNAQISILEEIVADPHHRFRPKELEELTGKSAPSVRTVLNSLTGLGLLIKDDADPQRPIYTPNVHSSVLTALTFLSMAVLDDRDGTDCMAEAITDYCFRSGLVNRIFPAAFGSIREKVEITREACFVTFPVVARDPPLLNIP